MVGESEEAVQERLRFLRDVLADGRQDEFARQIGLNPKAVGNWFTGTQRISLAGAKAIRASFGVPLDWIYFGGMVDALPHKIAVALRSRPSVSHSKASKLKADD